MPKILKNEYGGLTMVWDKEDWAGGLHPMYRPTTTLFQKPLSRLGMLGASNAFDPYRFPGFASPGFAPTSITNVSVVTSLLRKGKNSGQYAYPIGGALVQKLDIVSKTFTSPVFHTITHGGHTSILGDDVEIYSAQIGGTNASRYWYSFNDATDWDVGTFDLNATFDDDFMSTVPTNAADFAALIAAGVGYPHPLIRNQLDQLIIGDRNYVHMYDGQVTANGTIYVKTLTLPFGYTITAFAKYQQFMMIFAYRASATQSSNNYLLGESRCFLWDNLSLDITEEYDLHDNYVSEAVEYKGSVWCFTQGQTTPGDPTRTSKLQVFTGNEFKIIERFIGNSPIRGGADIIGEQLLWNSEGLMHSYGDPYLELPDVLNKVAAGSGADPLNPSACTGMLKSFASDFLVMSSGTGAIGGGESFNTGYGTGSSGVVAEVTTDLFTPEFPIGQIGQVERARVFFGTTCSGGRAIDIRLRTRLNQDMEIQGSSLTGFADMTTITAATLVQEYQNQPDGSSFKSFDGLKLNLRWAAGLGSTDSPVVDRVEVDFVPINIDNLPTS